MAVFDGLGDQDPVGARTYVVTSEESARGRRVSEIEIVSCAGCAALVEAEDMDRHVRWHRQRDRAE